MTYNVFGGTLSLTQSINHCQIQICLPVPEKINILSKLCKQIHEQ